MSEIPAARIELLRVAAKLRDGGDAIHALQIEEIVHSKLVRRHWKRRTYAKSAPMSGDLAVEIRRFAASPASAGMSQQDIAVKFGVNAARVSEAINGTG